MGETFSAIVGWMLGLVLVYLLLTGGVKQGGSTNAQNIIKATFDAIGKILSTLQGNG